MSKYLHDFWANSKAELVRELTTDDQFKLTDLEVALVGFNLDFVTRVRSYKVCHYGCYALFSSGEVVQGPQIYLRKLHESNRCAESLPFALAQKSILIGKPDPIVTMVVHHANFDRHGHILGAPTLAAPCGACLRILEQVSQDCLIVIDVDEKFGQGRLVKAPIEVCWQYFAHARKHNGESKETENQVVA